MERKYLNLIFTKHAITRLYNRGITQAKAYETFSNPDGQLPGKIAGSVKFYKNYGKQRIEVIAKKNDKGEWVVFSCWAKFKEKTPYQYQEPLLQKVIGGLVRKIFSGKQNY
jgi:hypothetical protein